MSKLYRSREGGVTAVNTKSQLSTLGSQSAPGPLLVPAGAKSLKAIIAAVACDLSTAADGGHLIRLEGPGLPEGPETFVIGATGAQVATGGSYIQGARRFEVDVPVTPSNEILIFAENTGEDSGTTTVGVTLEFEL
jgi:hypothetical protein